MRLYIATNKEQKQIHPSLVWQEITSYIRGSIEAKASGNVNGVLDLEGYVQLGKKRAPNFSYEHRRVIYPIFLAYQSEKAKNQAYDQMDFLHHLFKQLGPQGYEGLVGKNVSIINLSKQFQ